MRARYRAGGGSRHLAAERVEFAGVEDAALPARRVEVRREREPASRVRGAVILRALREFCLVIRPTRLNPLQFRL